MQSPVMHMGDSNTRHVIQKKKIDSDDEEVDTLTKPKKDKTPEPDDPANLNEDEMGRRGRLPVGNQRAKQKSPSPEYLPSELEWEEDWDDLNEEFNLKSKKKKKEAKFGKGKKVEVIQEDETPCCKCLRSEQPEWSKLNEQLQDNLKELDQSILKNDRLNRRLWFLFLEGTIFDPDSPRRLFPICSTCVRKHIKLHQEYRQSDKQFGS